MKSQSKRRFGPRWFWFWMENWTWRFHRYFATEAEFIRNCDWALEQWARLQQSSAEQDKTADGGGESKSG